MDYKKISIKNNIFSHQKCGTHPEKSFTFYCFTCHKFICDSCFKEHNKHELEIKEDLEELSSFILKTDQLNKEEIKKKYINYKTFLLNLKEEIDKEISIVAENIDKLDKTEMKSMNKKFITDYDYEEYQKINFIYNNEEKMKYFNDKICKLTKKFSYNKYKNFRWVSNEVNIIEASSYKGNNQPDIILGKIPGDYYLSDGTRNHFLVFDFGKTVFINKVKITTANFECILKNFIISVKNPQGEFEEVGKYLYMIPEEYKNNVYQEFSIGVEGKILKLTLVDNWGLGGGAFILIKRMLFEIAEIVENKI